MKKSLSFFAIAALVLINFFIFSSQAEAQYTADGTFCSTIMINNSAFNCKFAGPIGRDLPPQTFQPPGSITGGDPGSGTGGDPGSVTGRGASNIIPLPNPLKGGVNNLFDFIKVVVNNVLLPVGGVVATMYIIYSGFLFVTAQGDPKKIETAKASFTYAVIGTAILLGAWAISEGIAATIRQIVK